MEENPYQAPQADVETGPDNSDYEVTRKAHLSHEMSIKTIGLLYWLGAISGVLGAPKALAIALKSGELSPEQLGALCGTIAVPVILVVVAIGLRKFKKWARICAGIFSTLTLLLFPIGTIIGAYFLFLLFGKKSKMVFSPEYQEVIAATPHVKYKTSKITWIILGVVVLLIFVGVIVAAVLGSR